MSAYLVSPTNRTERRLLILAGAFLGLYSIALSLSNAARLRSWQVDYRYEHWLGFLVWVGMVYAAHRVLSHLFSERDPILLPVASLLAGWGLLTIWRLSPGLGLRQSAWLVVITILALLALRLSGALADEKILQTLRGYKYVWLTTGLLLTAATLILGTNPLGIGPRLWLGCCGLYLQPSEPLKLLLIVYLAAYLADRQVIWQVSRNESWQLPAPSQKRLLPLLAPTLVMTGLAMLLLVFQRDLGTAAIFLALYAIIVFAGTGDRKVLFASALVLILASLVGYRFFDVVSLRVDAWINPWLDPSGRSYQIVQSLLAVANGGIFGRGPGLGNPGLVPISQSDFIFSSISEESGLVGAVAMLALLGVLVNRGLRIATQTADPFHRLLAVGISAHLVGQSILIIAGNLRLLPLTGVTLPFVSYGGSSLLVSFFELLCLLLISNRKEESPGLSAESLAARTRTSLVYSGGLMVGLASVALVAGWWSVVRAPALLARTDNPRRSIGDRYVRRGSILDRHGKPLAESSGVPGSILRTYPYPQLGPIVGYTHPVYGQAGLEASLDATLRGLQGYPALTTWWQNLLYGYPPPGLDIRTSLDLDLQAKADQLLAGDPGAIVLLNAQSGEILAISSSPGFDANTLDSTWESLINDPAAPLFDRPGMGLYPAGDTLSAFLLASLGQGNAGQSAGTDLQDCALQPSGASVSASIAAGCPQSLDVLTQAINQRDLLNLLQGLGFYSAPAFPIETLSSSKPADIGEAAGYLAGSKDAASGEALRVSPLQMALAAGAMSNKGALPAARLVISYQTPAGTWETAPINSQSTPALLPQAAENTARLLAAADLPSWEVVSAVKAQGANPANQGYAWYIGGTLPEWQGAPLAIAVLLEQDNPQRAQSIGRLLLQGAMNP